jgi:hypothetical protein
LGGNFNNVKILQEFREFSRIFSLVGPSPGGQNIILVSGRRVTKQKDYKTPKKASTLIKSKGGGGIIRMSNGSEFK